MLTSLCLYLAGGLLMLLGVESCLDPDERLDRETTMLVLLLWPALFVMAIIREIADHFDP